MMPPPPASPAVSPIAFLERTAAVFPTRTGVVDGERRWTWAQLAERARRLAVALQGVGIARGDRVAVLAPASAQLLEAHFGAPAAGAVLVAVDGRVGEAEAAAILRRSAARMLLAHARCERVAVAAARRAGVSRVLVWGGDSGAYEAFLQGAAPGPPSDPGTDEDDVLSLMFGDGGSTGQGVAITHRGAYVDAVAEIHHARLDTRSVFLWEEPAGAGFPWAVTAVAAKHVCVEAAAGACLRRRIVEEGVTHVGAWAGRLEARDDAAAPGLWSVAARDAPHGAPPEAHGFGIARVVGVPSTGAAEPIAWRLPIGADERARAGVAA